jgi:pilus assembly protein Flp/PilA
LSRLNSRKDHRKVVSHFPQRYQFSENEEGATAVEYAVMLAQIIGVCIAAITTLGTNANATFSSVGNSVGAISGS